MGKQYSSRPFTGPTNEVTIINQINAMAELLDSSGACINNSFIVAGYTNPAHSNRHNEIWFLERPWATARNTQHPTCDPRA